MNFIRKIIENNVDTWVKKQFTRYGRGDYENRALVQVTKTGKGYTIGTSFEFAGEFAYALADSVEGKVHVIGGIITTQSVGDEIGIPIAGQKQFAGIRTFLIDTELSKAEIKGLFERYPSSLIFLSFSTKIGNLKTKVKNPKSAKPGTKMKDDEGGSLKADFCSFKVTDTALVKDLLFDVKEEFQRVFLNHTFSITDLEIPKEYLNDFAGARLHAMRKGRLIREITIDGKKEIREYPLEV